MSDAQDMLTKMRAAKEQSKAPAAAKKTLSPEEMQVRLLVTVHRRRQLTFWLILAFLVFASILGRDMNIDKPWWLTGLPIIGLGLMICLIPLSEEWEYRPWQTRARQYERHQLER